VWGGGVAMAAQVKAASSCLGTLGGVIFAQAMQVDPTAAWFSVLIQTGSFGLIAYLIVFGLPALQKDMKADHQAERADFAESLRAARDGFTAALKEGRESFTAALEAMTADRKAERADFAAAARTITDFANQQIEAMRVEAREETESVRSAGREEARELRVTFAAEQKETRQHYAEEAKNMRAMYIDAVNAMRTAVHDVRDVAGAVVNKANLAIEVQKHAKGGGS
jgi:hypothetical protein